MSEVMQGTISKLVRKPSKFAGSVQNFIALENVDGLFGAGFCKEEAQPKCFPSTGLGVGDEVEFDFNVNGNWKNIEGVVRVITKGSGEAPVETPRAGGPATKYSAPKGNYGEWTTRDQKTQESIQRQTARRDAIDVCKFLLDNGALPLGNKNADKLDIFLGFVDHTTDHFLGAKEEEGSDAD